MAFIRVKYVRSSDGQKQFGPYSYLVESYREDGQVKQRHLAYLGPGDLRGQDVSSISTQLGITTTKTEKQLDIEIQQLESLKASAELQEQEMKKRADWNQEGKREFYEKAAQDAREWKEEINQKIKKLKKQKSKLGTTKTISDKQFLKIVDQEYKKSDKLGDMVHVPELTKRIQKETGLSKEEVHKRLYEAYIDKKIDLQPGKGKGSLKGPDDATFQYMQPRKLATKPKKSKRLGTTFSSDLQHHFVQIDESGFKGGMVSIPDLWRKMKKDYSKEEFRRELLRLEKERVIDLQTVSDTKLISSKNREGGFYMKDGKLYDYDERPGSTKRGYINYVVWRK